MAELVIDTKKGGKGRGFSVTLLGFATARAHWPGGGSGATHRPVYLQYAGTDQAVRAFTANLRSGRLVTIRDGYNAEEPLKLEVPRNSGFKVSLQRLPRGVTIATGWLPALCALEVGVMPEKITFLFAPPTWWVSEQADALVARADSLTLARYASTGGAREAAMASLFCAFLDRRTPMPIINDPVFHRRLWLAARGLGWYRGPSGTRYSPGGFYLHPERLPGLEECSLIDAPHTFVEELIKHETARYFAEESPAWLLEPGPVDAPATPLAKVVHPQDAGSTEVAAAVDQFAAQHQKVVHPVAPTSYTPAAELAALSQVSLFDLVGS